MSSRHSNFKLDSFSPDNFCLLIYVFILMSPNSEIFFEFLFVLVVPFYHFFFMSIPLLFVSKLIFLLCTTDTKVLNY